MANDSEKYLTTENGIRSSYGLRLNPVELANLVDDSNPAFGGYSGRGPSGLGKRQKKDVSNAEFSVLSFEGRSPQVICVKGSDIEAATEAPVPKSVLSPDRAWGFYRYCFRPTGTIRLLSYEGTNGNVNIPDRIDGVRVTSIASNLFRGRDEIRQVTMPDTIEYVGHHAFSECINLRSVRMPSELRSIAETAFSGCSSLEEVEVTMPSVKLGRRLFSECRVTRVVLGPLVERLADQPWNLPELATVVVDDDNPSLSSDGVALFARGREGSLKLVKLLVGLECYSVPKACGVIGGRAFDSVESLRAVELPEGVRRIGRLSFAKTSITSISLPSTVVSIGEKAFYHCSSLKDVHLREGIRSIGPEAFAYSGIASITLPASLRELGMGAFSHTPAEECANQGAVAIDADNRMLDIDADGGLYCDDTFLELIGLVDAYAVRPGTRKIANAACKRHRKLARIEIPDGVTIIGSEAFAHNRKLVAANLPDSLYSIGEGAFEDTSVGRLSLGPRVIEIGKDALVVQGTNQLSPRAPIGRIDLNPLNNRFYMENGMLCERNGSPLGGDSVVVYVGPDSAVRIPEQVVQIDDLAFCGVDGLDEISFHSNIQSICSGALSLKRAPRLIHVPIPAEDRAASGEAIDGARSSGLLDENGLLILRMPCFTSRYRTLMPLFHATKAGLAFDFDYYDTWVAHSADMSEFAPAACERLKYPISLNRDLRSLYEKTIKRKSVRICSCLASKGDMDALRWLYDSGLISDEAIETALASAMGGGNAQETACLLELRHASGKNGIGLDFSL